MIEGGGVQAELCVNSVDDMKNHVGTYSINNVVSRRLEGLCLGCRNIHWL